MTGTEEPREADPRGIDIGLDKVAAKYMPEFRAAIDRGFATFEAAVGKLDDRMAALVKETERQGKILNRMEAREKAKG